MRSPRPWYRKQKDCWCICLNGSLQVLARGKANKAEALTKFHELMLHDGPVETTNLTLAQLCDLFLDYSKKHHEPCTFDQNFYFLNWFCKRNGRLHVRALKPYHLPRWLERTRLRPTSQNKAIGTVNRCFNWGIEEGYIQHNPFHRVRRPSPNRRTRILSEEERALIFGLKIRG
jgi:hypothetical protein